MIKYIREKNCLFEVVLLENSSSLEKKESGKNKKNTKIQLNYNLNITLIKYNTI